MLNIGYFDLKVYWQAIWSLEVWLASFVSPSCLSIMFVFSFFFFSGPYFASERERAGAMTTLAPGPTSLLGVLELWTLSLHEFLGPPFPCSGLKVLSPASIWCVGLVYFPAVRNHCPALLVVNVWIPVFNILSCLVVFWGRV